MNSMDDECTPLKREYDSCFNSWFRENFLKGDTNDVCGEVFTKYQKCVKSALKKEGIDLAEVEQSMLGTPNEKQSPQDS